MGLVMSRYRKKKKTEEVLEKLQKDIDTIEHNLQHSLERQKVILGKLLIYSIIVYISAVALTYFNVYPTTWQGRVFTWVPLIAIPLLVFYTRQFVSWIYKRDIAQSKVKLSNLLNEKRKTLDEVMDTETYKKAKEILEKYAPEQIRNQQALPVKRPPVVKPIEVSTPFVVKGSATVTLSPQRPSTVPRRNLPERLVRPICSNARGYLDRFVERLVGDGPNNRYALICCNCSSHNGMALEEEFEYLAFRCVYCGFPNQSRKVGPRLALRGPSSVRGPRRLAIDDSLHSSDSDCGVKIEEVIDGPASSVREGNEETVRAAAASPIVTEPEPDCELPATQESLQ